MLGFSYGEVFLLLGATAALIGPKDLPKVARTAGRLAGRAVGYVQSARGQLESILHQSQANQVHKELQDTMAQLEAIRHEIRNISIMNPGPMTRNMVENSVLAPPSDSHVNKGSTGSHDIQRAVDGINKNMESISKVLEMGATSSIQLQSQATTYARLAESPGVKDKSFQAVVLSEPPSDKQQESPEGLPKAGQMVILPVSAESAGLLPAHKDCLAGSDVVLEAILEADVAHHAKEFFKQQEAQVSGSNLKSV
eukprot:Gb_17173 [translate_table: standard]